MLVDQIRIITDQIPDTIEKIIYEIQALAANGKRSWSKVVFDNRYEIQKYFTNEGFTVIPALSKDKFPKFPPDPILTISW